MIIPLTKKQIKCKNGDYDSFGYFCASMGFDKGDVVAVLKAYFDESYNQPNPKRPNEPLLYTVGCWLSTAEKWSKFDKRWKRILEDAGIEYFHASTFESRFPPYDGWSDTKRLRVQQDLLRAISDYTIFGSAPMVHRGDWEKFIEKRPALRDAFGRTPYGFDVMAAIGMVTDWCNRNDYSGPVRYIFAELKGQGNVLDFIFKTLLENREIRERYRLDGTWSKGLMRLIRPLQAADIIAYEFNKRAANHMSPDRKTIRGTLRYLNQRGLSDANVDPIYFGKTELHTWGNDVVKERVPLAILCKGRDSYATFRASQS